MTGTQLNALINYKAHTTDTTFTQADKLVLVNIFKDEIASMIVERNNGMFLIPQTFDLVASSTSREYFLGDDLLNRLHKVEIKFASGDARKPAKYIKDYAGSETESEIVKVFSNTYPNFAYTIRRRALFLLSGTVTAVTGGGRIWNHIFPADLANLTGSTDISVDPSTTSFGFPRQFHELLARRVVIERKGRQPKPIPLTEKERTYETDLKVQLDAIAHIDNSGEIVGSLPPDEDMWNNGWDL